MFADHLLEVVERSTKFLQQVVSGGHQLPGAPLEDRHLALALLCELGVQQGELSEMLNNVVLLLHLGSPGAAADTDNRLTVSGSAAPLLPLIRRLESIPDTGHQDSMVHPTQCFLQYLDYPDDESCCIDLAQTGVVIMSHLDRLARAMCPLTRDHSDQSQRVECWGSSGVNTEMMQSVVSMTWCGQYPVWCTVSGAVVTMVRGERVTINIDSGAATQISATLHQVIILNTEGEVFTADISSSSSSSSVSSSPVTSLRGRTVTQISAGHHHIAVLTQLGQVYTWTVDSVTPGLVTSVSGHHIVRVECGQGPDHHLMMLTDQGLVYTSTELSTKIVETLSSLRITQLAAGM